MGSSSANHVALLAFLVCLLPHCGSAKQHSGYDVVSVAESGNRLSAGLKLVGGTTKFGPDVKRLSLSARQVHIPLHPNS
jgi:hypothetical protein